MATPTITTDLTTVAIGYASDAGSWGGGKSLAYWTEGQIEGSEVVAFVCNSATVDYELAFTPTTAINIGTSSVLRMWHNTTDPFRCDPKASKGISAVITDNSNVYYWYHEGSDSGYSGGWFQTVIDTQAVAASEGGTPAWTSVSRMGVTNFKSVLGKNTETAFMDAIRYGNNLNAYGGTSVDEIDIDGIYLLDFASAYGICWKDLKTGVYQIRGALNIGDSASTNNCYFLTEGVVIIAEDLPYVASDTLQFNFVGNSTGTTDIQLLGCFVGAAGERLTMDCSDTDITDLDFTGNTFQNVTGLSFQSGFVIQNNVFLGCYEVEAGSSTFENNTFNGCIDTSALLVSSDNTKYCSFISAGTGHAILIESTGTYEFVGHTYSGYATVDGSTGNECVYNNSGGAVTINVTGGDTPTIRNGTSATTTVVAGAVTVKVTVTNASGTLIDSARVFLQAADGTGPFPYQDTVTIVNSGTTATVTHATHGMATNDKIEIRGASLAANNGVFSITYIDAGSYSYTMDSTPGSSPTGTITSTFVALEGLTVAGVISTSRVYPTDQPVTGWARKSSGSPYYKTGPLSGSIDSADGYNNTAVLILDE